MKRLFQLILFVLCLNVTLSAQNNLNNRFYRTWVYLDHYPFKVQGALYKMTDSTISISNSFHIQDYKNKSFTVQEYPIEDIRVVKLRKNKQKGKGVIIGAVVGFFVGGSIAYLTSGNPATQNGDYNNNIEPMIGSLMMGTVYGGLLGLAIGSIKVKANIGGSKKKYKANYKKLKKYPLIQR